jgi:hypothetical protein
MAKGSMRGQMPVVTAWIDGMRAAFGAEHIDGIIKAGVRGQPVFFASENGHTVGTPAPPGWRVLKDASGALVVMDGDKQVIQQADDGDRRRNQQGTDAWQR